ncbi:MAG: hypothetical protein H7Y03_07970 [Chitinophagaceae bacterium]|nr:hypothetical protein [Chitinophagaceae bacterium]
MDWLKKTQENCKKATSLIERRSFTPLTPRQYIDLKIHLAGCSWCRLYASQSKMISSVMQQILNTPQEEEAKLEKQYKDAMQKKINDKMGAL